MTGTIADRYEIVRPLGEGGAASVYLARDLRGSARLALKFFPPIKASTEEFRREAAATLSLRHPALIQLMDAGVHEGSPFLALEYVEGGDLRTRMQAGPIEPRHALGWLRDLFGALDALHRAGMVHGDVKPENIILGPDRIRLVDFGRARLRFVSAGTGVFPGTAPYMHPDLFAGGSPSPETDTFAAWVTTYELLSGQRPFTVGTLRWTPPGQAPNAAALAEAEHDALVQAGLRGELASARRSWLALSLFLAGRREPLPPAPPPVGVETIHLRTLQRQLAAGTSTAVVGPAQECRLLLEGAHRAWVGTALWGSADWGAPGVPLSSVVALVARLGDVLGADALASVRESLGPLAGVLAGLSPASRAWLGEPRASAGTPVEVLTALRGALTSVPGRVLAVIDGFDRLDGPSRRFLNQLAVAGDVVVCGSAFPGAPHGLSTELVLPGDAAPTRCAPVNAVVAAARALNLSFGPLLAEAAGVPESAVIAAALAAEAAGQARFDGVEVVPMPGIEVSGASVQALAKKACHNLDSGRWPLLVARYAAIAGERDRLAETVDLAIESALTADPAEALRLALDDPRPPTGARLVKALRVAALARDMGAAAALLEQLRIRQDVSEADQAEAEGEYRFRLGQNLEAIVAFRRAARALGEPVDGAWRIAWDTFRALVRLATDRSPRARPNARLARVFERLHDLHLATDHGPMLAVHHRWLLAGPAEPRARAMDVIWKTALGRHQAARKAEASLAAAVPESANPVGAAVIVLHRSIVELWRGETIAAFSGATDACDRLCRAGDPYLAALASTTIAAAAIHIVAPAPMVRLARELHRIIELVGDVRAKGWLLGLSLAIALQERDEVGALAIADEWVADASSRRDSSEAVARRLRAEIKLFLGNWRAAAEDIVAARRIAAAANLRLDLTDAVAIPATLLAAQSRIAGESGFKPDIRGMARLVRRSPRWEARALGARGAWCAANGDHRGAMKLFSDATAAASRRRQVYDAWLVLRWRSTWLNDESAAIDAEELAKTHGLVAKSTGSLS